MASRGSRLRAALRAERGQILPLLIVMMVLLIGAGMLVLWLGFSSGLATKAQTAADAAALEGEQVLVNELRTPHYGADGVLLPPTYDPATVCAMAAQYAADNKGYLACPSGIQFIPVSGTFGTDVEVTVQSQQALPKGSVDAGSSGLARARASTDPFSQDSPPIANTEISCDASVISGSPFDPPTTGTGPGFFAKPGTDYTFGCEPKLAGKLQTLATAQKLHLTGVLGYDTATQAENTDAGGDASVAGGDASAGAGGADAGGTTNTDSDQISAAHACGAASKTQGLKHVTDGTLKSFGLTRPFPGAPDEIELVGSTGCTEQTSPVVGTNNQPVGFGNSDVHLVPLNGGPIGSDLTLAMTGPAPISYTQLQLGCVLYKQDERFHVDANVLLATFLAAWDESTMRNITTYTPGELESLGVFQQQADEGWGTPAEEVNPVTAVDMFLLGDGPNTQFYNGHGADPGAIATDAAHPGYTPWYLTEQVQHSTTLDGSNYMAQLPYATKMINQIKGGACNNH